MSTKPSFHEDFSRGETVKGSSDRGFGLTVGGILVLIALVRAWLHGPGWLPYGLGGIGLVLVVLGLALPRSLGAANRAWMKLGLVMFKVVNPVVLSLVYLLAVVPIGLMMRMPDTTPASRSTRRPRATGSSASRRGPRPTRCATVLRYRHVVPRRTLAFHAHPQEVLAAADRARDGAVRRADRADPGLGGRAFIYTLF